jgi:threonine dehydrogenase-like Zn-dependent dehydrogenase
MKALVFLTDPEPWDFEPGPDDPELLHHLKNTPVALKEIDDPTPIADDWAVLDTRVCGICGSDSKQVLMDFEQADDNMMTAFITFPQVLGHEVVGTVREVGPAVEKVEVGQRVVLNPWLSCDVRGISPRCPACEAGDLSGCWNFTKGGLSAGIHTGNAVEATGGFAEHVPAHESMLFGVPDSMSDEEAVLADPWSVSFHAITRNPPPPGSRVLVYGAGALGSTSTAILTQLYDDIDVGVVARWSAQADLARKMGATVFEPEPREALIEAIAEWSGAPLLRPWEGLPVAYPGHVDVVYDTVGSPLTVEAGMRVLAYRGTLVQMGVGSPARFEWTPWYFKELRLVGSNAFGFETFEGENKHAIQHYLDLTEAGRMDLTGMLTHRFRLDDWRDAFTTIVRQGTTGAIKVAFDYR